MQSRAPGDQAHTNAHRAHHAQTEWNHQLRPLNHPANAKESKNCRDSWDQRPPTSAARTTSLALPPTPASSGWVRSFHLLASPRTAPSVRSAPRLTEPSRANGDTSVVSTTSRPCRKRSKSLTNHVGAHPGSCLSLQTLAAALSNGKPLLPRTPEVAQARADRGRGRWRRRKRSTRKGWESNRVNGLVGKAVKATHERGPHCDLIKAPSWADKVGQSASLMMFSSLEPTECVWSVQRNSCSCVPIVWVFTIVLLGELSACRLCFCWHFGVMNLSDNLLPRPPTDPARGVFWSCRVSGRFGDSMLWGTRGAHGARGWDASAIPPRAGLFVHKGSHCLMSFLSRSFFRSSPLWGEGVLPIQTWLDGVTPRAQKNKSCGAMQKEYVCEPPGKTLECLLTDLNVNVLGYLRMFCEFSNTISGSVPSNSFIFKNNCSAKCWDAVDADVSDPDGSVMHDPDTNVDLPSAGAGNGV